MTARDGRGEVNEFSGRTLTVFCFDGLAGLMDEKILRTCETKEMAQPCKVPFRARNKRGNPVLCQGFGKYSYSPPNQ